MGGRESILIRIEQMGKSKAKILPPAPPKSQTEQTSSIPWCPFLHLSTRQYTLLKAMQNTESPDFQFPDLPVQQ